jgi:hypothetical protein
LPVPMSFSKCNVYTLKWGHLQRRDIASWSQGHLQLHV